ncbi:cell division protein FtsH [Bremerella cremea]
MYSLVTIETVLPPGASICDVRNAQQTRFGSADYFSDEILMDEEVNAYHEAGHALMALMVGARVRYVTLEPEWDDGPDRFAEIRVEWPLDRFTRKQLYEKMVLVALAGPVAEMIHNEEPLHPGFVAEWAGDWEAAWIATGNFLYSNQKRVVYLESTTRTIYDLLGQDHHWAALAAIVDNLIAHETLDGEVVEEIVQAWL